MARTATLTAIKHDGTDVLILGKSTPFLKVREEWKRLKAVAATEESHSDYKEIQYQESDGHAELRRYRTPADQKKHIAARAAEDKAYKKAVEESAKQTEIDDKKPRIAPASEPEEKK